MERRGQEGKPTVMREDRGSELGEVNTWEREQEGKRTSGGRTGRGEGRENSEERRQGERTVRERTGG